MASAAEDVVMTLDFTLDRAAEVPIGVQLAWAIRTRIEDGRLTAGRRLPGLREVAEVLGVNSNTVRAVYSRLELEGLVDSRQGSGTFVAAAPPRGVSASAIATSAAQEALEVGVDPREVAAALYVTATRTDASGASEASRMPRAETAGATKTAASNEASRKRLLRSQIAALQQTVGELEAEHPTLVAPPAEHGAQAAHDGPRLPSAEELEQVRLGLLRRLAALQAQIDALIGPSMAQKKPAGKVALSKRPARRSSSQPAPAGA